MKRLNLAVKLLLLLALGAPCFSQDAAAPEQAPAAAPASAPGGASSEAPPQSQAGGPSALGIAGMIAVVGAIIGAIVWLIMAMEKAWLNKAAEAARELGCEQPPYRTKTFTEDFWVHQWVHDGVPMALAAGSKAVSVGQNATVIMGATITASLPKKLPFQLAVAKGLAGPPFKTGDAVFDGELAVVTSRDEAAAKLLDSGLRGAIRELFQSGAQLPTVNGRLSEEEVELKVYDRSKIKDCCVKTAALARALSRRAEALGLLEAAPAAAQGLPSFDPAGPALALPSVSTRFPNWRLEGPWLLREEGAYFLIRRLDFERTEEGAGEILGGAAGIVGGLVGMAIDNSLADTPAKPQGLGIGAASAIADRFRGLPEEAQMAACREFFVLPREHIQKARFEPSGELALMTSNRTFFVSGEGVAEKAKAFLSFRGYPVA